LGIVQLLSLSALSFEAWDSLKKISSMYNKVYPFLRIIFLLLLAILVSGCVRQTVIYPDFPSEKILAVISNTVAEDDILSAIAQIDLVTIHGYQPVKAAVIIKKPSYLRLELLPVIGTPAFFLTASPEKMSIFLPSKGEFYRGLPTVANLERFLPWQFNIEDIVMIFSGTYPSLKEKVIAYQSYREEKFLRIEMKAQSGCSQIIWVGGNNRLLKLVRNDEQGKEVYNVKYDRHDTQSPIAGEITISMADGITSLSIKYSDIKIEKATDLSIFDLPIPDNVKVIMLDGYHF
jgi:outer membrane lipoprotein-sorting protein